jgi:hypothetical protein
LDLTKSLTQKSHDSTFLDQDGFHINPN